MARFPFYLSIFGGKDALFFILFFQLLSPGSQSFNVCLFFPSRLQLKPCIRDAHLGDSITRGRGLAWLGPPQRAYRAAGGGPSATREMLQLPTAAGDVFTRRGGHGRGSQVCPTLGLLLHSSGRRPDFPGGGGGKKRERITNIAANDPLFLQNKKLFCCSN